MIKKIGAIFKPTTPTPSNAPPPPNMEDLLAKEESALATKQQATQMRLTHNIRYNTFISTDKVLKFCEANFCSSRLVAHLSPW
jgi:hypothetical protein